MPLVFVDLKSLRHLFTENVCPTMKSHTLQEVQDSEKSRFTNDLPFRRANFSLATSQKGSGLLL